MNIRTPNHLQKKKNLRCMCKKYFKTNVKNIRGGLFALERKT